MDILEITGARQFRSVKAASETCLTCSDLSASCLDDPQGELCGRNSCSEEITIYK